jgi:hypothetical protein
MTIYAMKLRAEAAATNFFFSFLFFSFGGVGDGEAIARMTK